MEHSKGHMLDTNIFGDLMEGAFRLEDLPSDGQFWATPVQWEEISKAPYNVKAKFKELIFDQKTIVPAAFAWNVPGAGWDQGEWRLDGKVWHDIKKALDDAVEKGWAGQPQQPKEEEKKRKKENNSKDASIAEAAMFYGFTLITRDGALAKAAEKHGIKVLNPKGQSHG